MPRPSLALPAALLLAGLLAAPIGLAQGIPGLPVVPDGVRPTRAPAPEHVEPKGLLLDRTIAIVNEGIVTQSELEQAITSYMQDQMAEGRKPPPPDRLRAPMLEVLITRELQLQRAARAKIPVSEDDLNEAMRMIARQNNQRFEDLPAFMKAEGVDYADVYDNVRKELLIRRLQSVEVLKHINVSPRELEQHLERLKKLPNENDEFDVSDILISVPSEPTKAQLDELQKKAQEVYERAATEDFSSLAITFSNALSAQKGGSLGKRAGAELPPELVEAIVKLKPGEVSKPFQTSTGFHIVKLNGISRAAGDPVKDQVHLRHILAKTNALEDDGTVSLKLSGLRQQILNGADFAVSASVNSQDTESGADGGELPWLSPDEIDDEAFARVVKGLKDNEISQPFQSGAGWHIVQLIGRRKFDITEDAMRERAYVQLRDSKAEEEIELWRRQMREEAFIEILEPKT